MILSSKDMLIELVETLLFLMSHHSPNYSVPGFVAKGRSSEITEVDISSKTTRMVEE